MEEVQKKPEQNPHPNSGPSPADKETKRDLQQPSLETGNEKEKNPTKTADEGKMQDKQAQTAIAMGQPESGKVLPSANSGLQKDLTAVPSPSPSPSASKVERRAEEDKKVLALSQVLEQARLRSSGRSAVIGLDMDEYRRQTNVCCQY
jgi:hypothetical protein